MKRVIVFGAFFVFISCAFTSCEGLGTCKVCRQVTYVDNSITNEGEETEYCDADLVAIQAADDIVSGNTRITWKCR